MSRDGGVGATVARVPVGTSAVVGALAFVVGYVATAALLILDFAMQSDAGGGTAGSGEGSGAFVEFMGVLFYNVHFLAVEISSDRGGTGIDLLTFLPLELPTFVYKGVPVALLFVGGFVVASRVGDRLASGPDAAAVGASLVVAYLPLVVVGTRVFTYETTTGGTTITIGPPLIQTVLRVGLFYPVVVGGLGGLAYFLLRGRRG